MGKPVEVVAALIWREDRFFICQRPENKARGLLWEFAGGKVEAGESKEQALQRECREELDISLTVGSLFAEVTHSYPDLTVHLWVFNATTPDQPKMLEHKAFAWITPEQIPAYSFCPADEDILKRIREERG